jgi:cupin 2 domain-containing protein
MKIENIFANVPDTTAAEVLEIVLARPGVRIERIVSHGQATPEGEWYDQSRDEWVLLMAGSAGLLLAGEAQPRSLQPGDYLLLPAGCRHRVEWTDPGRDTVWLAVHLGESTGETD